MSNGRDRAATPPPTRVLGTLAFLVAASLIVLDATPRVGPVAAIAERIDFVMDVTGLWQGPWNLFAPDVDKVNVRITAEIRYANGLKSVWRSPDWERLSTWERFESFRFQEYIDTVRRDDSAGAWPSMARYLARVVPSPKSGRVTRVTLTRSWAEIPSPRERFLPAKPYTSFDGNYAFHTWRPETSR